jgi:hypothetical protein
MSGSTPGLQSLGLIARGAQGSVLLVYQRAQKRFLALKIVRLRGGEAEARRQLAAQQAFASGEPDHWVISPEASGLGSDAPPDIEALVPRDEHSGQWLWLLMPYVHGPNALELALSDPGFSWAEVAALCSQVAARLARRPEGQAHLDLKPENVLVDVNGRAFLVDQHLDHQAGTPGYAAPEQRTATSSPNGRADLFALGRTCQRLLARISPGPSDPPDMVPPWPELPDDASPETRRLTRGLTQLVRELCATDPGERGEVQEVARRFLAISVGLGGPDPTATLKASLARASLPARLERFAAAMASQPKTAEPLLAASDRARSRRLLRPTLAVAFVVALSMGGAYRWGWLGAGPALAAGAGVPQWVDAADPLGSDAFGNDHYTAELTLLGPKMHADRNHGYVGIRAAVPVLAVELRASDDRVLWRQDHPKGSYRFDVAPGKYSFVQVRRNPLGEAADPIPDPTPFTILAGLPKRFETDKAPQFAPKL